MLLRATTSFFVGNRLVNKGDLVDSSDPVCAGREAILEPLTATVPVVEQATAAPGEKRAATKRPARKPSEG